MNENLKVGDRVQLKSGSPIMKISGITNVNGVTKAWCDWFNGINRDHTVIPLASLKPAPRIDLTVGFFDTVK
jgi:uncharacterized protein YodC (DUF2158 family)